MPKPDFRSAKEQIEQFVRVNHAGEFGARCIYEGQLKYTKDAKAYKLIHLMMRQELVHLNYFENQIRKRNIRPTALLPLWRIGGYLLGCTSALMGTKIAMLTTEAVEEVIEKHYQKQIDYLANLKSDKELLNNIKQFQQDETEHKHIATEHGGKSSSFANSWTKLVKKICVYAINLSKKI